MNAGPSRVVRLSPSKVTFQGPGLQTHVIRRGIDGTSECTVTDSIEVLSADDGAVGEQDKVFGIDGIFGVYELLSGLYIALIMASENIFKGHGGMEFRKITKVAVIPLFSHGNLLTPKQEHDEEVYLELLHKSFSSHDFYFSTKSDVTSTLQRKAQLVDKQKPLWARADPRFFWNRHKVQSLISAGADDWVTPVMSAYIEIQPSLQLEPEQDPFHLLLVSRRSCFHQGCRYIKRGLDAKGNAANFVETEQLVLYKDGRATSFTQIRGSVPVLWSSPVSMKYTPKLDLSQGDTPASHQALARHVTELAETYLDDGQGMLLLLNLVDQSSEQGHLGDLFESAVRHTVELTEYPLHFLWFDFHRECTGMDWSNLSRLVAQSERDTKEIGYFHCGADGEVLSKQRGVVRTNCLDGLDRTNAVQSLFARRSLLLQMGMPPSEDVLSSPYPEFERAFRGCWGNNADALSLVNSGTKALKTDFTRLGVRTFRGMIQDGVSSCMRYYMNNFKDGPRQDGIDLLLGLYRPDISKASPFAVEQMRGRGESDNFASFRTKFVLLHLICYTTLLAVGPRSHTLEQRFMLSIAFTGLVLVLVLLSLVKNGACCSLCVHPRLMSPTRPQLEEDKERREERRKNISRAVSLG
ncbi:unnamed protein product [Chrysoparadoxa australica]